MAGKKRYSKKGGGHQNHSSSNNFAPKLSEQEIQDLVVQATQLQVLLNQRHQKLKQMKDFAFILSTKWLREWKDYVGYEAIFSDDKQGNKKQGKKRPGPPNSDLTITSNQYLQIPQELESYQFLNTIINSKLSMNDDYIAITYQLWDRFNTIYGPGTEIKRPLRITKSKSAYVDGSLQHCDFIFVNYGQQDFTNKLEHAKTNKGAIQQLILYYTVQYSAIWELDQLYEFFRKLCLVKYNNDNITLWLCQNFLGVISTQQNFIKAAKAKTYQMYATKLQEQDYESLDLQDFLKRSYIILVQIGDSKVVATDVPDDLFGYCQQCLQKKHLQYHCKCEHKHYCSRQCQIDDQVYHFNSCKYAFTSFTDEEYDKKKTVGVSETSKCGLKNLGNTCYMNSSIQTFLGLDFLVDFLTQNKYKDCISKSQKHCDMFLQHVSKTCKMMGQQWDKGFIEPWDLKGQVNYFLTPFKGYKQHDAIDFFMGFINTINDCLAKPNEQQAYHPLIKDNLLGEFDSLVICPDCDNEVKNIQCFTQLTLPIKSKAAKTLYNYVLFDNPLSFKHGKAQVKQTWEQIKSNIGVPDDCIMYGGQELEAGLAHIDQSASPSTVLKKYKKQLLFYPYLKLKQNQFILGANFIHMQSISGQNMKANNAYPFPVVVNNDKTMGHFFIDLLRKLNLDKNSQIIQQIELKYDQIENKRKQLNKQIEQSDETSTQVTQTTQNKQSKQSKQESKKQLKKQSIPQKTNDAKNKNSGKQSKQEIKQKQQKIDAEKEIQKQQQQLNNQLKMIMQQLNMKVFIEDTKKQRNICFFCKRRCDGCLLQPDFRIDVQDLLGLKSDEARLFIYLTPKPDPIRVKQDLGSCGDSSLKDCLQLFGQPQTLDEQNAWYCPQCDDMRLAFKQLHISKYPKYMIIQLSRFKNGAHGKVKNNEPITYNQFQTFGEFKYRLLSVIIHEGSIEGGHYWAIGRRGQQYYIFNDQKVVKTDKISNKNAYILCYKQEGQEKQEKQIKNCQ